MSARGAEGRQDRRELPVTRLAADRATAQSRPIAPLDCSVDGRKFAAIPVDVWCKTQLAGMSPLRGEPEGTLQLSGRTYVLVVPTNSPTRPAGMLDALTARELQVAYRIGEGACDKSIAYDLGISEYTVREHVRRVFHKLQVSKRAAVVRILYRNN